MSILLHYVYMRKRFLDWSVLKNTIHVSASTPTYFKEGEVWWCSIGENIGVEINGKGNGFSRPVYIYKKLSKEGFMSIPLSTQIKEGTWFVSIFFNQIQQVANLAQARTMSAGRLLRKEGVLEDSESKKIKNGFRRLYH